jgi:uncharacterized membrane protein
LGKPPSRQPELGAETTHTESTEVRIEDAIERVLEGKVARRDLNEVARRITQIAVSEQFSGPMPHPKHLRDYDEILPGAAERILAMAERNLKHNMTMDEKVMEAEVDDLKLGMWLGGGLFGLLILAAFGSLFVTENAVIPGLFLGAAAVGGVVAFIKGRNGR